MKFLLDTNVVSETRRKAPDAKVLAWFRRVDPSAIHLSVLTLGEIARGAENLARRDAIAGRAIREWLDGLLLLYADRVIAIDIEIAETWGRLSAARPLPVIDGLLAATASARGMTLVTRNRRDFSGTGVAVVDPWNA